MCNPFEVESGLSMPMPSSGIIALLGFCAAGIVFMLWVLYHFVLESTKRNVNPHLERVVVPERERPASEKRPSLIA
jgi:hypothetical protein